MMRKIRQLLVLIQSLKSDADDLDYDLVHTAG